ncbi:methyltransferase [Candidatus Woesearchaeota archaeon]|nr:methyltransferase [Candidatus Woesearchaeota archaeon]
MYEPREDSFLLCAAVERRAHGSVLDMGTGSGILAETARCMPRVISVTAVDIDPECVRFVHERYPQIAAVQSDLFSSVAGTFDTIIFNPPYLPQDPEIVDRAIYGGKQGHELIERFLKEARHFLAPKGAILLLFSSLTGKQRVERAITESGLAGTQISSQKLHFEELYVYHIQQA